MRGAAPGLPGVALSCGSGRVMGVRVKDGLLCRAVLGVLLIPEVSRFAAACCGSCVAGVLGSAARWAVGLYCEMIWSSPSLGLHYQQTGVARQREITISSALAILLWTCPKGVGGAWKWTCASCFAAPCCRSCVPGVLGSAAMWTVGGAI